MSQHVLFYFVFLSQVLLISFYFPRKIYGRMQSLWETYPPETHPRLYPGPIENHEKTRRNFRVFSTLILVGGLLILAALLRYPHDIDLHNAIAMGYFFVQFVPLMLLDFSSLRYFKMMRIANTSRTRKAELNPRRLFDFISPLLLGFAVIVYVGFVLFVVYMKQFDYPWFGGYLNIAGITAMNLFFAGLILFNLFGKKLNPHQAPEDRARQIEKTAKGLVIISIAATLFLILDIVLSAADKRDAMPVALSLYLQLIALISFQAYQINFSNFDVYKDDPLVT